MAMVLLESPEPPDVGVATVNSLPVGHKVVVMGGMASGVLKNAGDGDMASSGNADGCGAAEGSEPSGIVMLRPCTKFTLSS